VIQNGIFVVELAFVVRGQDVNLKLF